MRKFIPALLLVAVATCAFAGFQDSGTGADGDAQPAAPAAKPVPAVRAPRAEVADQAAMEEKVPHEGPTFGQSRVERRREKCSAQAQQQGLTGAAREEHMNGCVER